MEAATEQDLEERIRVLHEALEVVIAAYVDAAAAACIGVPRASIENSYLARAHGCRCREFRIVQKLITDAEELARKQQAEHDTASL
jgi:hypothetical protein